MSEQLENEWKSLCKELKPDDHKDTQRIFYLGVLLGLEFGETLSANQKVLVLNHIDDVMKYRYKLPHDELNQIPAASGEEGK